jgi:hypothetical protein
MRNRQRMPSVFSLSLLDMLCCGLGAVIFVMLLYAWEARRQAQALAVDRLLLERTSEHLATTRQALGEAHQRLVAMEEALAAAQQELAQSRSESEKRGREQERLEAALAMHLEVLATTRAELEFSALLLAQERNTNASLAKALADARGQLRNAQERLAVLEQQFAQTRKVAELVPELRRDLSASRERIKELEQRLAGTQELVQSLERQLATEQKQRMLAEEHSAAVARLQQELMAASRKLSEAESSRAALLRDKTDLTARVEGLQKQLASAREETAALQRRLTEGQSKASLLESQLAQAERRFAGVDLSGSKVVFLVDMSGSMGFADSKRPDPAKWPFVCDTVAQVAGSLRQLQKFQVVLFSDRVAYPLGSANEWLDYDPGRTPAAIKQALLQIKPGGDTNMYLGFEAAFRFRSKGMDTVYLFSDGLPNVGPGAPTPPARDEASLHAALGKFVRDTLAQKWNRDQPKVRIHAIGFYFDSPALGSFLWALTRENHGGFVGLHVADGS